MSADAPDRARVLAKLAATIVLAGALVAGMLLPFVGGTGLAARNSASLLDALPVELTDETPAGNTRVLAADGSLITNFYRDNRTPVTSDRIAPVMKQALVAIEDSRFEEHNGLDVQGTLRALATNVAAERSCAVSAVCSSVCFTSCWVSVEPPSCTSPAATLVSRARIVPCTSRPLWA